MKKKYAGAVLAMGMFLAHWKDAAEQKRQKMQAPAETREMYRRKRRPGARNPEKIYLENLKRRHWTGKM